MIVHRLEQKQQWWDMYFLKHAVVAALGSKCPKAQFGAVIVDRNRRVVSTGFNGKPAGSINDHICLRPSHLPEDKKLPCCLHAEANAIMYCDRKDLPGATMYVSGKPCEACALLIMQAGIARLVYLDGPAATGHIADTTEDYWTGFGVPVQRVVVSQNEYLQFNEAMKRRVEKALVKNGHLTDAVQVAQRIMNT